MSSSALEVAATSVMTRRDWAAVLTIGFGVSLVIMDATIVNVALPAPEDEPVHPAASTDAAASADPASA